MFILFVFLALVDTAYAHKGHHKGSSPEPAVQEPQILSQINETYKRDIKPIFKRSCFDCHSNEPVLPWYYKIPGARQLIESDMKEAKEHLDFTNDFPFSGHGSPSKDLSAIRESMLEKSMPPFRYKILHWKSKITETEMSTILKWIEESQKLLEKKATP